MNADALCRRPGPVPQVWGGGLACWMFVLLALLMLQMAGCSPALDWRQIRPEAWSLSATMPCRPDSQQRQVSLAGVPAALGLWVCSAGGFTFALASVEAVEPERVGPVLQALLASAQANVQGRVKARRPAVVPGMTPHPEAVHLHLDGQMPDGRAVQVQVLVFVHGLRVFQATALGQGLGPAQVGPFFDGIEIVK